MKPRHIYDNQFQYRASYDTDLKRTFARIIREQKKQREAEAKKIEPLRKVNHG